MTQATTADGGTEGKKHIVKGRGTGRQPFRHSVKEGWKRLRNREERLGAMEEIFRRTVRVPALIRMIRCWRKPILQFDQAYVLHAAAIPLGRNHKEQD
jgi:hypothetical protein